jgi:dihydrofolate reductase
MSKVVVNNNLTLDGVMQAPGRPDEDTRGGSAEAVARLKERPGKDIVVLGSGELVQSLMRRGLVDEYLLLIHPLVLGKGRRLFPEGSPFAALRLVDTVTTATGVVIATYRTAEPTAGGSGSGGRE